MPIMALAAFVSILAGLSLLRRDPLNLFPAREPLLSGGDAAPPGTAARSARAVSRQAFQGVAEAMPPTQGPPQRAPAASSGARS